MHFPMSMDEETLMKNPVKPDTSYNNTSHNSYKHITKEGVGVELEDMTDKHLKNTINLIERKAKSGLLIKVNEHQEIIYGKKVFRKRNYKEYIREKQRRDNLYGSLAYKKSMILNIQSLMKQNKQ